MTPKNHLVTQSQVNTLLDPFGKKEQLPPQKVQLEVT